MILVDFDYWAFEQLMIVFYSLAGIFATLFFITRIVFYPYVILSANTVCSKAFGEGNTPSYLFFIGIQIITWWYVFFIDLPNGDCYVQVCWWPCSVYIGSGSILSCAWLTDFFGW